VDILQQLLAFCLMLVFLSPNTFQNILPEQQVHQEEHPTEQMTEAHLQWEQRLMHRDFDLLVNRICI
jgi:hypothetical protein